MRLEDNFDIVRELGRGGFGRVLHVRDRKTGEEWAAKVLINLDSDSRQRFIREVKQAWRYRRLRHVIKVAREYLQAEPPFFLMPLAKGGSLADHIGQLSPGAILSVMRQLLEALHFIHADGGVHRDVKPDNVFLPGDGTSALGDFGIGNSPNCTVHFTMSGMGTPGYAAPELFAGEECSADAAADIFSAGATWFHLLTGRHPRGLPLPLDPRAYNPNVAINDASWVRSMTSLNRWERPSASQVMAALAPALAAGDHPLPKEQRKSDNSWLFAAGVGLVALFLLSRE